VPSAADAAVARFRQDVSALAGESPWHRLGVAVSGGPDSMALLFLAHRAFPGQVLAATVDHGLRPEAAQEAAMVARWCADRGFPHDTLSPVQPIGGNIQSEARIARYALLDAWAAERAVDWLATAHHADDQLETLLMRLNRGSGVAGLAGIRSRNGRVLRPLLRWRRSELRALAEAEGLPFVDDPSNRDERFDRVALRNRLAGADWLDAEAAARSAEALAEAEAALSWTVRHLAPERAGREGVGWRLVVEGLPRELVRRLVLHALGEADPQLRVRGETLDTAIAAAAAGGKASIGGWLIAGGKAWSLMPAPARRGVRSAD
jgi:tRNA(Ile)-lysidine synthase